MAKKAHEMAVKNLDQKTRTIYRENVQLTEALSLHLKDADEMKKVGRVAYVCTCLYVPSSWANRLLI